MRANVLCCLTTLLLFNRSHAAEVFPIATNGMEVEVSLSAAFDGTNYLVALAGGLFGGGEPEMQLISSSGALIGAKGSVGRSGDLPYVVFNGTNYFMTWTDSNAQIYGQLVSRTAALVGSPFPISPANAQNPSLDAMRPVAFGGGRNLIVYRDSRSGIDGVYGRLVSASGAVVGAEITISADSLSSQEAGVAFDGSNFLVIWQKRTSGSQEGYDTVGVFISPSGTKGSPFVISQTPSARHNPLNVVFAGTNYFVAWNKDISAGHPEPSLFKIYGRRVSTAGALLGEEMALVTGTGGQLLPGLSFDGARYLLNWTAESFDGTSFNIYFQYLSPEGLALGSPFTPFTTKGTNSPFAATSLSDGSRFLAVGSIATLDESLNVLSGDAYGLFLSAPGEEDQQISFGTLSGRVFGDAPFPIDATASSSLPVSFSILSGPARVAGTIVSITGAGTVVIRASQSGNGVFRAAAEVDRSFTVGAAPAQQFTTSQGAALTFPPLAAEVSGLQYAIQTEPSRGTASAGNGTVTYAPNPADHGADTFRYTVSDPISGVMTPVTVNLTVTPVAPVFSLEQASFLTNEGSGVVTITIVKNVSIAASVAYATAPVSASPVLNGIGDYTHTSGTLSFASGETNKTVSVPINDDRILEVDEFFSIQLFNPGAGVIGSPASAQIRIADNDAATGNLLFTDIRYPDPRPLSAGRFRLEILPAESGGLWRFVGQLDWHVSGEVVGGLVDGLYTVEFNGASGGYIQPAPMEVAISGGGLVSSNVYYISTTARTGSLVVNLSPGAVANASVITQRGQWRRKGESLWRDSGSVQTQLNEGAHVIELKPVDGYTKPPDRTVGVVADRSSAYSVTYLVSASAPGLPPAVVPPTSVELTSLPYAFDGQISTEAGLGSGFAVRERVVLTAAHVVFDESKIDFAKQVRWHFQRYKGSFDPGSQTPRGWYVSDSYSAQRRLEATPGVSSPQAKNLDAAALYFSAPAARGGYGGYLASDADNNEWLVAGAGGSRLKMLVGYPIDGIPAADQGKLHATAVAPIEFTQVFQRVYKTTEIKSYGGNSGGPLCVEYNGRYYPAAIFLGGSGQLDVRAIDSLVVDLINRAEVSGNGGENNTSGGVITFAPVLTDTETGFGHLTVQMEPAAAVDAGAGWRIVGGNPAFVSSAVVTVPLVDGDYNLEFADAAGYVKPPISPVQIFSSTNTIFQARYEPANKAMLTLDLAGGLRLQGSRGSTFRVESKTSLDPAQPWQTFATITLATEVQTIPGFQLQADATRFFRAVLITP